VKTLTEQKMVAQGQADYGKLQLGELRTNWEVAQGTVQTLESKVYEVQLTEGKKVRNLESLLEEKSHEFDRKFYENQKNLAEILTLGSTVERFGNSEKVSQQKLNALQLEVKNYKNQVSAKNEDLKTYEDQCGTLKSEIAVQEIAIKELELKFAGKISDGDAEVSK
jgi:chromosome segregation ATPase